MLTIYRLYGILIYRKRETNPEEKKGNHKMKKDNFQQYEARKLAARVYDALAAISNEEDASEENMKAAVAFFLRKFYNNEETQEEQK